jgi:Flp pilus assembly protein TadD
MGDTRSALTRLTRNAADYPHAATAAFGLGRAYRTVGNVAKARAEFRRALQLDPHNNAAKQALDAIKGA